MNNATNIKSRLFAADLNAMLALSDARKAENTARRAVAQANAELCAYLLNEARRQGKESIDWTEYFRNAGMG